MILETTTNTNKCRKMDFCSFIHFLIRPTRSFYQVPSFNSFMSSGREIRSFVLLVDILEQREILSPFPFQRLTGFFLTLRFLNFSIPYLSRVDWYRSSILMQVLFIVRITKVTNKHEKLATLLLLYSIQHVGCPITCWASTTISK